MIKLEEVPNPLNPNAEVLEYTQDGIRPKPPPSNVPKRDPIWEFFYPTNAHEGTIYTIIITSYWENDYII